MNGLHSAFTGVLGTDADLRFTSSGKAVAKFSVAVSSNRTVGDGAETQWVRVAIWEDEAERLAPALKKGVEVYVEGKLTLNTWMAAEGTQRSGLDVSAWTVQLLGAIGRKTPPRRMRETEAVA